MNFKFANELLFNTALFGTAALLILGLILGVAFHKRGLFSFPSYSFKVLVLGLLALALAQPYREEEKISNSVTVLLDISDSNEESVMDDLLVRAHQFAQNKQHARIAIFSGSTSELTAITDVPSRYTAIKGEYEKLNLGSTNLEEALSQVIASDPGSVILVSDGFETAGDVSNLYSRLQDGSARIYPITPEGEVQRQNVFKVSNLNVPLTAPSEKSVDVKVSLQNSSAKDESGILEVTHDGKVIMSQRVTVPAGREVLLTAKSDPSKEGIKEISALLKPDSNRYSKSVQTAYLTGETREKILVISGTPEDFRYLNPILNSQSYQVRSLVGGESRSEWSALSEYSVVVLNNVPLRGLPRNAATEVESYVKEGGGLLMIGGDKSFGLGGYLDSPIEDALPVDLIPPQTVEKRLNVAMQLVIDKSRSMSAGRRLDFAKEAAYEVVRNLKDEDFVGVMGFDANPFVVIRMGRVSDIRAEASRRIGLLWPKGSTALLGAVDEARRDLERAKAGRKHMLILTDGEVTDAPRTTYYELVRQARFLGITVSTVMLGGEGDETMLKEMANLGGGKFYATTDASSLPRIFIADVKVASGEETMQEDSSYGVRIGPDDVRSTDIGSYPRLRGYVKTKIKNRAQLELEVVGSRSAEPLLASWKYGKGQSIAFTSDANGRWSESWIGWPKIQKFWSDLVDSMRSSENPDKDKIPFDLVQYFEKGALHLDLAVYSEDPLNPVTAELTMPGGEKRRIDFDSITRGRYLSVITDPKPGRYEFRATRGKGKMTPVAFSLSGELFGERKGEGLNLPLLSQLADVSGGKINPTQSEVEGQVYKKIIRDDLSVYFILAAFVIFLLEIVLREVTGFRVFSRIRATI